MLRPALVTIVLLALAVSFALGRIGAPGVPSSPRASRDPAPADATGAAVHDALMTPDALQRAAALGELLDGLGPASLAPVQAAYEAVVLDATDFELQLFVQWWARVDAPPATEWAYFHHLGRNPAVLSSALRSWAQRDPQAARAWMEKTVSGAHLLYPSIVALLWGWDESGQPGIWDYIGDYTQIVDQQYALAILVRRRLLRDGPEATYRWAHALPDDERGQIERLKLNTFRRIGAKLTEIDPSAAASWAELVGEGEYGDGVYQMVAWNWVRSDGPAALDWLATLPPGPQRRGALDMAFQRWATLNRPKALAWLDEQPDDPWLDPARYWQAMFRGSKDPPEGMRMAGALQDESLRKQGEYMILRAWRNNDREAADAWVAENGISEELRDKLENFPRGAYEPAAQTGATP